MVLKYEKFPFTPILGWSISRYEVFDKCKRQYFYTYYAKYVPDLPLHRITKLKELTSVPLEIGNVVHDVMEAFLRRLQKSDSNIDEERFLRYAEEQIREAFERKTFMETYYGGAEQLPLQDARAKVQSCLGNFLQSPCSSWIFMKALINKDNWLIEPAGYGETRLEGTKAYCKMDFLFPVDDDVYILDWKTGRKDPYKHSRQLVGYAAAARNNFKIPPNKIFPKIVYLYPAFDELEIRITEDGLNDFFHEVKVQTQEMHACCKDTNQNIPLPIDSFPLTPSPGICGQCRFRELCFPGGKGKDSGMGVME